MNKRDFSALSAHVFLKNGLKLAVIGIALSACSGTSTQTQLSMAQVKSLTPTATMPTGSASYVGRVSSTQTNKVPYADTVAGTAGIASNEVIDQTADLKLNADFSAKTVAATLSNLQSTGNRTFTPTGGTAQQQTSSATSSNTLTGNGTITGNTFIANTSGNLVFAGTDYAGAAITAPSQTITLSINGTFVGTNAEGIYATKTTETATLKEVTEILAVKQ